MIQIKVMDGEISVTGGDGYHCVACIEWRELQCSTTLIALPMIKHAVVFSTY